MNLTIDLATTLVEDHPLDTARILERYDPQQAWAALLLMGEEVQPAILENFHPDFAARVISFMPFELVLKNIRLMTSEASTDIIALLSEESRMKLLSQLPTMHSEEIETLLQYPEDSVGSLMSPDFVALRMSATVRDATRRLRRMSSVGKSVNYVYVVDQKDTLEGVLVMRDLILAEPDTLLKDVMLSEVLTVDCDDDIEDAADLLVEQEYSVKYLDVLLVRRQ